MRKEIIDNLNLIFELQKDIQKIKEKQETSKYKTSFFKDDELIIKLNIEILIRINNEQISKNN